MAKTWKEIEEELLHMIREDEAVREALAQTGELYHGYHPAMEKVHLKHAKRLKEIIDDMGTFPTRDNVSEEAVVAALRLTLHAISWPEFMRAQEVTLQDLAKANKVPKQYVAFLIDRIRFYEGRKQVYATNRDWDENGIMKVSDVEDEEHLNERRATMDLEPLESLVVTVDWRISSTPTTKTLSRIYRMDSQNGLAYNVTATPAVPERRLLQQS